LYFPLLLPFNFPVASLSRAARRRSFINIDSRYRCAGQPYYELRARANYVRQQDFGFAFPTSKRWMLEFLFYTDDFLRIPNSFNEEMNCLFCHRLLHYPN
jgi:hypothetical protein